MNSDDMRDEYDFSKAERGKFHRQTATDRSIARAAVAAGHPGVGTDRLFRLLPRDPAWTAEAERWLARFAAVHDKAAPAP